MEVILDKMGGIFLSIFSALIGIFVYFFKRTANEVEHVARELVTYKESQAKETEIHRSKTAVEMSDLKIRIESVSIALGYINKNISDIQTSVTSIASLMQDRKNGGRK